MDGFRFFMSLNQIWDKLPFFAKTSELRQLLTKLYETEYIIVVTKGKVYYKKRKDVTL